VAALDPNGIRSLGKKGIWPRRLRKAKESSAASSSQVRLPKARAPIEKG
jgi:hypothetical protein